MRLSHRARVLLPGAVRRHWTASTLVVLLVVAGTGGWFLFRPEDATAQTRTLTATVGTSTVKQTVSADGTITPTRTRTLTLPSGGTVTSVRVAQGDRVRKGKVLARMDTSALGATRDAARATLDATEEQYADDVDDDADDTQLASDKAQVVSARSALTSAQSDVDDATMTAPFPGRISAVDYAVGDSTGSGASAGSAGSAGSTGSTGASTTTSTSSSTGVTLISTGSYEVSATVDSTDLASLKKGQQATITPTGATTSVFGVVQSIGVIASSSDSTSSTTSSASFPVTIKVTGSTKGLYAGSSATVSITVRQVTDALTVPTQALSTKNAKTYVTVVENGKDTRRYVTVGDAYGASTVVTKGLSAGDTVLIASFRAPTSGGSRTNTGSGAGGPPTGGSGTGGFGGSGGFGGGQ